MADQFVGEIRLFAFGRVPTGWVACNGALLSIAQFDVLYTLLGTTYGGDGSTTFGVPDLRGRVPLHAGKSNQGNTYVPGQIAGEETHTLNLQEMATHTHALVSTSNKGDTATPGPTVHLATSNIDAETLYAPPASIAGYDVMADCMTPDGESLPHDNMMPTLIMNFCIATEGIYPSAS
ncbi:phage tail protein [Dongia sedimenti]|uniref:Tail fiber protein n=1 Tax=Dongia sedimenti TaxID=3064282 RepID=A0ABU0YSZ2_9PROT|nr:tail fiber protein [Rhodospirillaceae bacterium R-7]